MDDKQLTELIDSINNLNTSVEDFHKYVQDKDEAEAKALAESKAESSKQQEADKKAEVEQLEKETKFISNMYIYTPVCFLFLLL